MLEGIWCIGDQARLNDLLHFFVNFDPQRIARRIENRIGREVESDWTRARQIHQVWNFIIVQEGSLCLTQYREIFIPDALSAGFIPNCDWTRKKGIGALT